MFEIKIITDKITLQELKEMSEAWVGNIVKAVVDIDRKLMATGGQMHADEEEILLDQDSEQQNLWGINIHPFKPKDQWIEYNSMINLRPYQGNRSRGVDDEKIRKIITDIVYNMITNE